MKYLLPIFVIVLAFSSCKKKKAEEQAVADETTIQNYIAENGLNAIPTGSGLYYVIDVQGAGLPCTSESTVVVAYSGYFLSGTVFDESEPTGVEFGLANVIAGWTEGIPYFKEGGTGKLLVPSALGYGPDGNNTIPANSVLIFDIELISVVQ
ncbi:MAG: FKBP-type peptidyl-prolyl cis-trans isomerase FkpA [Crocinitomicaceae bacterium]|jgi:FKBP-type peptidyl-prolyl cis-trans isomerase FkpA